MNDPAYRNKTTVADIRQMFARLLIDKSDVDESPSPAAGELTETGTLELTGVSFNADEPSILGIPDYDYISREIAWYDSMSRRVIDMMAPPVPPIWRHIADENGDVNSNYGRLVYHKDNGSQFHQVVKTLRNSPMSRQAVMIYTRPDIHTAAGSDFICTNVVQYLIREGRLHAVVQMRSNDAVFGYRNDYAWQRVVMVRLLRELKATAGAASPANEDLLSTLKMGTITWQVGSLHIYPRHYPLLETAIETGNWWQPL